MVVKSVKQWGWNTAGCMQWDRYLFNGTKFWFKRLLQLRFDFDSTSIRLWFDYDDTIPLLFDFNSTRQSGHHDSMLMKAWIHTILHFIWEVCERAIPTSTIEGCYPMLIRQHECHSYYRDVHYYVIIYPDHCLLIGHDTSRRDEKMNMFVFRRSRIAVESQF